MTKPKINKPKKMRNPHFKYSIKKAGVIKSRRDKRVQNKYIREMEENNE